MTYLLKLSYKAIRLSRVEGEETEIRDSEKTNFWGVSLVFKRVRTNNLFGDASYVSLACMCINCEG